MQQEQNSFFDSKTLFAIVLVVGILFAWQKYMAKKYPTPQKQSNETSEVQAKKQAIETEESKPKDAPPSFNIEPKLPSKNSRRTLFL
jgi:predicted negative regulator of RcsB-dependent stress response